MQNTHKNLNEATLQDLEDVPFMNTERARLVVDYIAAHGPLQSLLQVDDIPGIGPKISEIIAQHFVVNEITENKNHKRGEPQNA